MVRMRKCPISALRSWSMGLGWSEMVNFMAVTTVVFNNAEGEFKVAFSLVSRASGDIRHCLSRHCHTIYHSFLHALRVPVELVPACRGHHLGTKITSLEE